MQTTPAMPLTSRLTVALKASYDVKEGDILEITFGERVLKVRVLGVKEYTAKADAAALYEVI